jgi:hypothetical protein
VIGRLHKDDKQTLGLDAGWNGGEDRFGGLRHGGRTVGGL